MPYPTDAAFRTSTFALLGSIWKKLPRGIERAKQWGSDWAEHSEPFVHVEGGESIAHVGVMEIEAVLEGRPVTLAGIHAVCTRADRRGRGLLRETMGRALAWVDTRYEAAVLWANDPAIYPRFGFHPRAEAAFSGPIPGPSPSTGTPATPGASASPAAAVHPLSLERAEDVVRLKTALGRRAPVSLRCGSREPGWLTLINLALWPEPGPVIAWLPDVDAIVVYDLRGRTLRLHDVIATTMPSLASILERLRVAADEVLVLFSPEALAAPELRPIPTPLGDHLMVRGPFLDDAAPFAFSPLTRC